MATGSMPVFLPPSDRMAAANQQRVNAAPISASVAMVPNAGGKSIAIAADSQQRRGEQDADEASMPAASLASVTEGWTSRSQPERKAFSNSSVLVADALNSTYSRPVRFGSMCSAANSHPAFKE